MLLHQFLQSPQCTVDLHADVAGGLPQGFGDFLVLQAEEELHRNDLLLLLVEPFQGRPHAALRLAAAEGLAGRIARIGDFLRQRLCAAAAEVPGQLAADDRPQPAHAGAAALVVLAARPSERPAT